MNTLSEEQKKRFDEKFHIEKVKTNDFGITCIFPLDDEGRMLVPDVDDLKQHLADELAQAVQEAEERKITGETSDGYHTFNELYEFRKLYNAALFNEWSNQGKYNVHKSTRHHDEEPCFGGGWFIVMATLPTGQISNHYEMKDWGLFKCEERERSDKWDGHTANDVLVRLSQYLNFHPNSPLLKYITTQPKQTDPKGEDE